MRSFLTLCAHTLVPKMRVVKKRERVGKRERERERERGEKQFIVLNAKEKRINSNSRSK